MAIEKIPDHVMDLARASDAARAKALSQPYSPEGWAPWLAAANRFLGAAESTEVEMAAKDAVRLEREQAAAS